ncbi:Acyl-CoA N-acyltransferase [Penicillium bovifimosum]|uniref:Acyl-CoA N-acyltransferase n=1 Tax=Penicillium bovifimosum TaxID=126998 RepID=A0A9W9GX01_9EURO|nr:Acyl-CoA N-acyltransferase [Penicillium bovifimosum]KAJ5130931.1 Acyl-CoA N-acyltransferase [Penicillium bovifimosum]
MAEQNVKVIPGFAITDKQLEEAAALFRDNYGVWGKQTKRAGQRVALSPARMRDQLLPSTAKTSYARVVVDGTLAGHAFACRWNHKDLTKNFRHLGLATTLLNALRCSTDDIYGIMSSHPAACLAAAKAFCGTIKRVSLDYIGRQADAILKSSPIPYIRDAKPRGTLFQHESEMISGVDTRFFVDHGEPNTALETIKKGLPWPLGDLDEGHEFLLIAQNNRRSSHQLQAAATGNMSTY